MYNVLLCTMFTLYIYYNVQSITMYNVLQCTMYHNVSQCFWIPILGPLGPEFKSKNTQRVNIYLG